MSDMIQNSATDRVNVRAANELAGCDATPANDPTVTDAAIDATDTHNRDAIAGLVKLAAATIEPSDMLAKYVKLGAEFLKHARWQRTKFKSWDKDDFDRLASIVETEVKLHLPIKDVRLDTYARIAEFVAAIKPAAPEVVKVSYYQIANKFLPMLKFSKEDVAGSIKAEWHTFAVETIKRQTSPDRYSMKELDAAIDRRKAEIKAADDAKVSPDKLAERERKAENAKIVAARQSATKRIGDAVKAAADAKLSGEDIAASVASMANAIGVAIPVKTVEVVKEVPGGFDPATASIDDCTKMMAILFHSGKISEIQAIADIAGQMLASFKAATVKLSA